MLAAVLRIVAARAQAGMATKQLADIAAAELRALGGAPAFLGHEGFPDVICISLNDEIVHGIPSPKRLIQSGDIISLDFGVKHKGMITDGAVSMVIDRPRSPQHQKLVEDTKHALELGVGIVRDKVRVGDIGATIENSLRKYRYGIPRDLVGHGVGHQLWEEPNIPNYGRSNTGARLEAGMTIAIEPMVTLGTDQIALGSDGWTIKTADGSWAAHFEHTVLVLEDGAEILTA